MKKDHQSFFIKSKAIYFGIQQLVKAAPKEMVLIVSIIFLQSFIPSFSLIIVRDFINWIAIPQQTFPTSLIILWGILLSLDAILSPIAAVIRVHLNEKAIAHCNLLLMEKANSIESLTPFEDSKIYDEIQFLKTEAIKRPLNFVFLISDFLKTTMTIFSVQIVLIQLGWWLPLLVILGCMPQAFSTYWLQKQSWDQMLLRSPEARRMAWFAAQTLDERASKEIRLFGFGEFLVKQYKILAHSFHSAMSSYRWKTSWQSIAFSMLSVIGNLSIFTLLIFEAKKGEISTGTIVMALQALVVVQMQLDGFIQDIGLLIPNVLFFDKLKTFLTSSFQFFSKTEYKIIPSLFPQHEICFDKVSFSYPDGRKVLSNISFSIIIGQKIAIVGDNGAGKSTIVKLLTRLYEPTEGRIIVDGIDLKEIDLSAWRERISVIFQDFGHYHLNARDNIGISNIPYSLQEIAHAAKQGGFDSVLSKLPNGYDSMLGKEFGGTSLSGGEWQKLAMSRAFLKKAKILILDEPTAALDPKSEHEVFQRFAENIENRTTFFITHRLGSVRMADIIFVLKDGQLIEKGTHESLMKNGKEYAHLFSLQAERYTKAI